ncbi:MAG: hypothetical protein IJP86_10310 [Synergistaceae bacterium]|nr:hypothetical protein [Synergistaceae bacterium]
MPQVGSEIQAASTASKSTANAKASTQAKPVQPVSEQEIKRQIENITIPAVNELVSALSRVASEITSILQAGNLEVQVSAPSLGGNTPVQRTFGGRKRAEGGIITRPEISLIGEAGREAIIPLERQSRGAELWLEVGRELELIFDTSPEVSA